MPVSPGGGAAIGGGLGAVGGLIGIGAQHGSAIALGQESVKNTRFLRKRQFQDAKLSMERAGINPILAARAGLGGTGSGAHMPGGATGGSVGTATAAGASAGAKAALGNSAKAVNDALIDTENTKQGLNNANSLVAQSVAAANFAKLPSISAQNARDVEKLEGWGGPLVGTWLEPLAAAGTGLRNMKLDILDKGAAATARMRAEMETHLKNMDLDRKLRLDQPKQRKYERRPR